MTVGQQSLVHGLTAEQGVEEAPRNVPAGSLDPLTLQLRKLREDAGAPSFSELTRRVEALRARRATHARDRAVGRMTVYDCFKLGRRRIDVSLVLDIVRAMGADEQHVRQLQEWCARLLHPTPPTSLPVREIEHTAVPLIGRDAALEGLERSTNRIAVVGMPGSGKTALAEQALRQSLAAGRIDRAVAVSVRGGSSAASSDDVAEALIRTLEQRGQAGQTAPGLYSAVADLLRTTRTGLLLDDVAALPAVQPLLDALDTPVIVVVRTRDDTDTDLPVVVATPWDAATTARYLQSRLPAALCEAEPAALGSLASGVGGLPLAAELLVARIQERGSWSLADHLDQLREQRGSAGDAMAASIEISAATLPPSARRALRLIAAVPAASLDVACVAALLDSDPQHAQAQLHALRVADLIEPGYRVSLHPVVRSCANEQADRHDSPAERRAALDRLVDLLLERGRAALAHSYPLASARAEGESEATITLQEAEDFWSHQLRVLLHVAGALAERRPLVAVAVSEVVAHHLDVVGAHRLAERVHRMALRAAERADDAAAIAACAHRVAQALVRQGSQYARSELLRARQLARQADDATLVLKSANTLAILAAHEGDEAEAARRFAESLEAAAEAGRTELMPALASNLGIVLRRIGDLPAARDRQRQAYELATDLGDEVMAAAALVNLSDVEVALGDHQTAVRTAQAAVRLTAEHAQLPYAYALTNLATALAGTGALDEAEVHHRAALAHAEQMDETALIASVRNNLGELLLRLERVEEAAAAFSAAGAVADRDSLAEEAARSRDGLAACAPTPAP